MSTEILAPLPGKITAIHIEAGKTVEQDDEILTIEAMKMETAVYAPCSGVVEKLLKKVGDEVEESAVIGIIA
jgi:acetyl-CoA carboxylase biotin carboxyl carrier protein